MYRQSKGFGDITVTVKCLCIYSYGSHCLSFSISRKIRESTDQDFYSTLPVRLARATQETQSTNGLYEYRVTSQRAFRDFWLLICESCRGNISVVFYISPAIYCCHSFKISFELQIFVRLAFCYFQLFNFRGHQTPNSTANTGKAELELPRKCYLGFAVIRRKGVERKGGIE